MSKAQIDELQIVIRADEKDAIGKIDKVIAKLNELQSASKGSRTDIFASLGDKIEGATTKTNNFTDALKRVKPTQFSSVADSAEKVTTSVHSLNGAMDEMSHARPVDLGTGSAVSSTEELEDALGGVTSQIGGLRREDTSPLTNSVEDTTRSAENMGRSFGSSMQEVVRATRAGYTTVYGFGEASKNASDSIFSGMNIATLSTKKLLNNIKQIHPVLYLAGKAGLTFGSTMRNVASSVGKVFLTPFSRVDDAVRAINNGIQRVFKNLKRVVMYRALRAITRIVTEGIKTGIDNAYQWALAMEDAFGTGIESATAFRTSMDSLATSALYVKNSLGAMAMPLLNILAPAVEIVVEKLVNLFNLINRLFAIFSGANTWTRALRYPKAYGEALDDASGSAGKLKDELITILGIDEINPMADAKDPSGRGSGASDLADDYSSMFEEVSLEGDKLHDILAEVFDPFRRAWETKGKGVMEALDNALKGIKATAIAVGTSFWEVWTNGTGQQSVELLLGILQNVLNTIGEIGEAFAKGWKTDNLGTQIVQNLWDALNSILSMWEKITKSISTWDFDFTGIFGGLEVLTRGIKEAIDAIGTSFATVFSARAEGTFKTILGIFEGIERVLGNIALQFAKGWNTDNLGTKIFDNIWEILDSILETIKDIIDMTVEWSQSLDFTPILRAFENLTKAIDPLVDLISDGLKWAWQNVLLPLGKWTIEEGLPDLINALAEALKFLTNVIKELSPLLKDGKFFASFSVLQDINSESWEKIGDIFKDLNDLFENGLSWDGILKPLSKIVDLINSAIYAGRGLYKVLRGDLKGGLNDLLLARQTLTDWGLSVEEAVDNAISNTVISPTSEHGVKLSVTAEIEKVEDKVEEEDKKMGGFLGGIYNTYKESGFKGLLGGLTGGLTGSLTKEKGFSNKVENLEGGLTGTLSKGSKFNPKVDKLNGSLTGSLTREGTFNPTVGGLTAQFGKTDPSKLPASEKTIPSVANLTDLKQNWKSTVPTTAKVPLISAVAGFTGLQTNWNSNVTTYGKAPMWGAVANFMGLQTNWNSKIDTYNKAPMWGAVANFSGLQTNWNSKISTYGKAPMWGAVANFMGLQTNWNSNVQTSGKAPMWNAVANFIKKATGWESGTTTWGSTANFTQKTTGWKSGTTTWNAVANFLSALTGWDKDTTVWEALAQFTDWSNALPSTPTIKATSKITKFTSDKNTPIEVGGTIKGYVAEMGGSFYNGSWHNIPQYASGGLPNHGSMFIAGEAGAELVGHIGGHTEVLNQSQMASALAEGMAPQAHLLQQLVAIGEQILAEQGDRNVVVSTSAITEGFQRMNRREGRTVVPVGV